MTTPNPTYDEVQKLYEEAQRLVKQFFDTINGKLQHVPGLLQDMIEPIVRRLNELARPVQEIYDFMNQLSTQPGSPENLKRVAEAWDKKVGDRLAAIAETLELDKLKTHLEWTGRGAEAYKATVPAQVTKLNEVKGVSGQLHTSLRDLADAIDSFWLAVMIAFAAFMVAATVAVAAIISIVGIPAAIAAFGAAATATIDLAKDAYLATNELIQGIAAEQDNITRSIRDLGETWARSNTGAMSHPGDWHTMS